MKYVDVTPRWVDILPTWLMLYRNAIEGSCTDPGLVRSNAVTELTRMAEAADKWNEHVRSLEQEVTNNDTSN